ncbi:MAG: sulfatase, partial [Verrucomicrobiota bacterium]
LKPPSYLEGRSLVPLLKDPEAAWTSTALTGLTEKNKPDVGYISIRNENGRYIRYGEGEEEFYHTAKDPREWTNQIENPEFAKTVETLRAAVPELSRMARPLPRVIRRGR